MVARLSPMLFLLQRESVSSVAQFEPNAPLLGV